MRIAVCTIVALLVPVSGWAQTTTPPGGSVLDTRIPPNAIDRATAASDPRRAEAARAADADRASAERAARDAAARTAPVAGSTMTDGVSGLGARPDIPPPPSTAPVPR